MSAAPKAFVVGHPVKHSRSPMIHGYWLRQLGVPGSYERVDVAPEAFPVFLATLAHTGFVGGNVTIPHKEAAFRLAGGLTDRARRLEAVNTLWHEDGRLCGDNTDILGFLAHLDGSLGPGWSADLERALVVGAGGAARAVVAGLVERGLEVMVASRRPEQAQALAATAPGRIRSGDLTMAAAPSPDIGLLINTTPMGMAGQPAFAPDLSRLRERAVVCDIVYVPLETPLLAVARARGLRTVDGLGMLLHQAVPGFARWFGVTPAVTPELRTLIAADIEGRAPGLR